MNKEEVLNKPITTSCFKEVPDVCIYDEDEMEQPIIFKSKDLFNKYVDGLEYMRLEYKRTENKKIAEALLLMLPNCYIRGQNDKATNQTTGRSL